MKNQTLPCMECQGPFSVILQMLSSESRLRGGTTLLGMCVSSPDSGTVAEQQPKCNCKKGRNLIQWLQMETHLKIIVLFKRARWMGSSCRRFFLGNERWKGHDVVQTTSLVSRYLFLVGLLSAPEILFVQCDRIRPNILLIYLGKSKQRTAYSFIFLSDPYF